MKITFFQFVFEGIQRFYAWFLSEMSNFHGIKESGKNAPSSGKNARTKRCAALCSMQITRAHDCLVGGFKHDFYFPQYMG
jgi:hypothetical protein